MIYLSAARISIADTYRSINSLWHESNIYFIDFGEILNKDKKN